MTEHIEIKNGLVSLVDDFLTSMVVFAAFDIDLFAPLINNKMTAQEVAAKLHLNHTTVKVMMECLAAFEILEQESDIFHLSEGYNQLFSQEYQEIKQTVCGSFGAARQWIEIANIARGIPLPVQVEKHMFSTGDGLEEYLVSVRYFNRQHTVEVAEFLTNIIESRKYITLMDLGGGHALYSLELAEKNPDLEITLVDLDKTVNISRELNKNDFRASRIRFISGDATNLSPNIGQFDVIMINDLLHSFNHDYKTRILKNCLEHLNNNGIIIISKFRYSSKEGYSVNALFSMKLHLNTGDGYLETDEELEKIAASLNCKVEAKISTYKALYIISHR